MMPRIEINDNNYLQYIDPSAVDGGGEARTCALMPTQPGMAYGTPMDMPLIPRSEWKAIIDQKKADGTFLGDILRRNKIDVLDQNGTNYCWINAPVMALMAIRCLAGQSPVRLSPASGGARIKGFRNVGGWGSEALEWIEQHGVAEQSLWPANAIDRRYDTPEARQNALLYRVTEWKRLPDRSIDHLATAILNTKPVPCGYNWWRHEVLLTGMDYEGNDFKFEIANSWSVNWGENGYGWLSESKATPDDAVVPVVAIGS